VKMTNPLLPLSTVAIHKFVVFFKNVNLVLRKLEFYEDKNELAGYKVKLFNIKLFYLFFLFLI
jgi:hypothetical protein